MSDPIARLWADAYMAKYANPSAPATAAEQLAGDMAEARAAALSRALDALSRGVEPSEADVEPLRSDPDAHLCYLDARDEALALHGGELRWWVSPDERPTPAEGDGAGRTTPRVPGRLAARNQLHRGRR